MSRIRLVPVMIIAVVSLIILFCGWWAYRQFNVVGPLKSHLESISGVTFVQVESGSPGAVTVHLGKVSDLQKTYRDISRVVTGISANPQVAINIKDKRTQELVDDFETLEPSVLEGVAKGNYNEMIDTVEKKASDMGVQSKVTMDEHNIYIQLTKGSNYFYYVMSYTLPKGGGAS